jgi:hypothetical protein
MKEQTSACRIVGALAVTSCFGLAFIPLSTASASDADWPALPNAASAGEFAVLQTATTNSEQFLAEWRKPGLGVHPKTTTLTRRGQPIDTYVTFRGCRADASGNCLVTVTYDVRGPTGKRFAHETLDVWSGQHPRAGTVQLSRVALNLVIDGETAAGKYHVQAATTDKVAGITLHTVQVLTVLN